MAERMRFNLKVFLSICLVASVFLVFNSWLRCSDVTKHDDNFYRELQLHATNQALNPGADAKPQWAHLNQFNEGPEGQDPPESRLKDIDCLINQEYSVDCRKDGEEVYLPFSFIEKYFEIYGELREYDGYERFEWHHSYSEIYPQKGPYSPTGVFMSFDHYNVEIRDRVKCISGIEGVPISTQWGPQGYFYPIQIAQYGLSHWSKYQRDKKRTISVVEDAQQGTTDKWMIPDTSLSVDNVMDDVTGSRVIKISASESLQDPGVSLRLETSTEFFLSFDFMFANNGSFTVTVETKGKKPHLYYLHYVCSKTMIVVEGNEIYHGIGDRTHWSRITRDIHTDFMKGVKLKSKNLKLPLRRVLSVSFRGRALVDNITLSSNAHLPQFYYAANWLVMHQDNRGGWPIMVTRKLASGQLELPPGWYSAMAQGQAMSLLVRAYERTGNQKYLDAAVKGTLIYDIPSAEGGVLAKFLDKIPWYEEYPTIPSSFVLNGFIYSLLGLYDLKETAPPELRKDAERLYTTGMKSLKLMLPFFDTGSGSIYDLRHFTLGMAPNLARWDYHSTHVTQLLLLATIDKDPIFHNTAKRWARYMKGKRASHN